MNGLIKQGYKTVSQYGIGVFCLRVYNYIMFKMMRFFSSHDTENDKKFLEIKGKYKGKRIFILGNGPSLNKMPLYLLKNEYTM